jgi:hypothetical protein
METRGFSRHFMWLTRPLMRMGNRYMFKKFRQYTEQTVAQAAAKAA